MKSWLKISLGVLICVCIGLVAYFIGQSNPIVKTKTIALTILVQEGDFEIATMDAIQIKAGDTGSFTVDVIPEQGFSKNVVFALTGMPPGVTVSWQNNDNTWNPGQGNLQCNVTIPLDNSLAGPIYSLTLTGTAQ